MIKIYKSKNGKEAPKLKKNLLNNFLRKICLKMISKNKELRKTKKIKEHGKSSNQISQNNAKIV